MRGAPIEIKPYRLPLAVPYRWSKGTQNQRAGLIVRAVVGRGVGYSEAALPPHVDFDPDAMADMARALARGIDPEADDALRELDLRECPPRLRCGLAGALLAARAAAAGVGLARFLAGSDAALPERVPVNDLIGDADPRACAQRATEAVARGQSMVKVKVTAERELDLQRIAAIRAAQPAIGIRIDPNECWPVEWAGEQLRAMERFGIDYCEEPLPRGTPLSAYAALRRQTVVPIALDDSVRSLNDVELIAAVGAADGLILKAQRVGGPDRLLAIVRAAAQHGLWCTVTSSLETALGLTLGLQCAALSAVDGARVRPAGIGTARYFAADVGPPPAIVDGHMQLPATPGLGFDGEPWWRRAPDRLA
jgi:L-alanine-DL-glutamate epimerase-like enolase superfamily enzyme